MRTESASLSELLGKTMVSVENINDYELVFTTLEGEKYMLHHWIEVSESVTIESIVGDLADLTGEPMLLAEESTSRENPLGVEVDFQESFTWTFYKFATRKGYVDVRWYGGSNGYGYSERVDFSKCIVG